MKALAPFFASVVVAAFCASATPAFAQGSDAVSLTQTAPASLRLRIATAAPLPGRVQVVRLSTGQTLFTEAYTAPAYGHKFDFSQAPSGRYLVWLQAGDNSHRCIVRVRTHAQSSTIRVTKFTSRSLPEAVAIGNLPQQPARQAAPVIAASQPAQ